MDSIAGLRQQCVRFQRDMSDKWEKESIKQDQKWWQMQIQMNNLRDELEQQQSAAIQPQEESPHPAAIERKNDDPAECFERPRRSELGESSDTKTGGGR